MRLYVVLSPVELATSDTAAAPLSFGGLADSAAGTAMGAAKTSLLVSCKFWFEASISRPSMSATNASRSIALADEDETIATASATRSLVVGSRARCEQFYAQSALPRAENTHTTRVLVPDEVA